MYVLLTIISHLLMVTVRVHTATISRITLFAEVYSVMGIGMAVLWM